MLKVLMKLPLLSFTAIEDADLNMTSSDVRNMEELAG